MSEVLYRKYRSRDFEEIVGQSHITATLMRAIKTGKIAHAYLFTGPRGTGKTSIARILAHQINQLPYDTTTHLDIIEIDAASNRRIDEIRDLRDKVHLAPTSAQYKVYIIDEVHMLTKEAFNALLKTLEEPPAHVIFILATTEVSKLPDTIISRTQRFHFKPMDAKSALKHLRVIADKEKIAITDDALQLITELGGGSMRDALSLLDQVQHASEKEISRHDIENLLGVPEGDFITTLIHATLTGDKRTIIEQMKIARTKGYTSQQLIDTISNSLKQTLLNENDGRYTELLSDVIKSSRFSDGFLALEIALLSFSKQPDSPAINKHIATKPTTTVKPEVKKEPLDEAKQDNTTKPTLDVVVSKIRPDEIVEKWQEFLEFIKTTHNTLYSVLRMSTPKLQGEKNHQLTLFFKFPFHAKRVSEQKNTQIISSKIAEFCGEALELFCSVDENTKETVTEVTLEPVKTQAEPEPLSHQLSTAMNIFQGAEVID